MLKFMKMMIFFICFLQLMTDETGHLKLIKLSNIIKVSEPSVQFRFISLNTSRSPRLRV